MEKKGPGMDNQSSGAGNIPELDSYDIIESPLLESLKNVFSLLEPAKQEIEDARRASLSIRSQQQAHNESEIVKELQEALDRAKQEIHALKNQRHSCCTDNTPGNAEKGFKEKIKSYESKVSDLEKENGILKGSLAEIKVAYQDVIRLQEEKLTEIDLQNKTKVDKILKEKEDTRSRLSTEVAVLKRELSENKTRLSKLMGDKLSNKNPDIADLSDMNRPTKIAEKFSELYDNQWTDAYEVAERLFKDQKEDTRIKVLLQLLMDVNKFCQEEFRRQEQELVRVLFRTSKPNTEVAPGVLKEVKDYWKSTAEESIPELVEKYLQRDTTTPLKKVANEAKEFTSGCVSVCWLMVHQDPQVVFHENVKRLEIADGNFYKAYTLSGKQVDYIVWPALLLYEGGPLLAKGVAQYIKPDEKKNEKTQYLSKKPVTNSSKPENEKPRAIQSEQSTLTGNTGSQSIRKKQSNTLKDKTDDFSETEVGSTKTDSFLAEFGQKSNTMAAGGKNTVSKQIQKQKQQQQQQQQLQQQFSASAKFNQQQNQHISQQNAQTGSQLMTGGFQQNDKTMSSYPPQFIPTENEIAWYHMYNSWNNYDYDSARRQMSAYFYNGCYERCHNYVLWLTSMQQ